MDLVHLIVDVVVKFLIKLVLNVLRQVVIEILVWELWLWELRERAEVGRILEALNVHHIWELEVRWRRHLLLCLAKVSSWINWSHVHVSELVNIVICHLIYLTYLTLARSLSSKLLSWARLLWMRHEILWSSSHELLIDVEWLFSTVLCVVNYILNTLTQIFGISTADI